MKLRLLLCCVFIAGTLASPAQLAKFTLTVKNVTPLSTKTFNFTVGADTLGTDSLDKALGEVEIPDIPLPGDIFYVWTIAPLSTPLWLSPKDFRHLQPGVPTMATHDMRVSWTGGRLEITWARALPALIDSMYITDGYSDFPNNIVKTKVAPGVKFETTNPALDRFNVLVWYNGSTTSVQETVTLPSPVQFYPNPVGETLHLASSEIITELRVLDLNGRNVHLWQGSSESMDLSLNHLAPGTYYLSVFGAEGTVRTAPFIHY